MKQQRNQSFSKTNPTLKKTEQSKGISLLKTLPFKLAHKQPSLKAQPLRPEQKCPIKSKLLPPIKLISESSCSTNISGDEKSLEGIQIGLSTIKSYYQQSNCHSNPEREEVFSLLQNTRSRMHPSKARANAKTVLPETGNHIRMFARQTLRTVVIIPQEINLSRRERRTRKPPVARSYTLAHQASSPQKNLSPFRKYSISGWDTFSQYD